MKNFIRNIAFVITPFVLLIIGIYIWDDPFLICRHSRMLYDLSGKRSCVNTAYQGIRIMNYYEDSLTYDSFILGSSRSEFYYIDDWKKYIGQDAVAMHFAQSSDNLLGTVQRTRYLYQRFPRVRNLLFVMDTEFLYMLQEETGHLFRQPWQVTGWQNFCAFHLDFIKAFYSMEYWKLRCNSSPKSDVVRIPYYHEVHKDVVDSLIQSDTTAYFLHNCGNSGYAFYKRPQIERMEKPIILTQQKVLLQQLQTMLVQGNTDFKIIISPLYNQVKLNSVDYQYLCDLFGIENVFDFSGKNEWTNSVSNYYESSHYRPCLCRKILAEVYKEYP